MRRAENFNPEWGYLAPSPGFMRILRIAIVAAGVGAGAGAIVVFSLLARPADESVAARTLAQPVQSVSPVRSPVLVVTDRPAAAESSAVATTQRPVGAVALAESPPAVAEESPAASSSARQAKTVKKHRYFAWWHAAPRGRGALALTPYGTRDTIGANWSVDPRDAY
jgi:hypothetical protein